MCKGDSLDQPAQRIAEINHTGRIQVGKRQGGLRAFAALEQRPPQAPVECARIKRRRKQAPAASHEYIGRTSFHHLASLVEIDDLVAPSFVPRRALLVVKRTPVRFVACKTIAA